MTDVPSSALSRRTFLGLTGAGVVGAALPMVPGLATAAHATPRFDSNPFTLGVASGDPQHDGVVLWTRLAPNPLAEDGLGGLPDPTRLVEVHWEVAEDDSFSVRSIVRRGTTIARPEFAHSVHVEVDRLRPDRMYWYRFRTAHDVSPVGRTRTAPSPYARLSSLSFAFVSCNNYPDGYFTAFRHLSEDDLDVVFHLGDYIYEGPAAGSIGRAHLPAVEAQTLTDYRIRYGQYKLDADLQAAHAAVPFIVVNDDHEVENNFAGGTSSPDGEPDNDPAIFLQRRAAAYQAYYENMPLRRTSIPQGPDIQLYRRLGYGRLVDFHVLDTRQYRSVEGTAATNNQVRLDPTRTLLGAEQEAWLVDGMTRSGAAWNVLAQQSKVAETDDTEGPGESYPNDNWDGYAYSRTELFNAVHDRGIDNMVILSGDAHVSIASDLKPQFKDPASPVVGAEFLGTSITSGGNGNDINATGQRRLGENPHLKFYNNRRGYQRVQLTPQEFRVEFQVLPYVNTPGAPAITRAVGYVEAGRPGVAQIENKTIV